MSFLYEISQKIMVDNIVASENKEVELNAKRFINNLNIELQRINSTADDWAAWDDTYQFIEANNTAYIDSNLADETFINLRLNMMLFMDPSRQMVFGKVYNIENKTAVGLQNTEISQISKNDFLYTNDTEQTEGGLILFGGAPMLVMSHPILTSASEGPIRGTLIMGRFFDKSESNALAEVVGLPLDTFTIGSSEMPGDFQLASKSLSSNEPVFTHVLNETNVAGYVLLQDVSGAPILITRVDSYRSGYLQGKTGLNYLIVSFAVLGVVIFAVTALLLEKIVLSRLSRLTEGVVKISQSNDKSNYVVVQGHDELSNLGCKINSMLTTIRQSREELRKHAESLESKVAERTADLKESQEKLKSIFTASPDAIIATDLKGNITECNRQMYESSGYVRDDLIGKPAFSFMTDTDSKRISEGLEKTIEDGSTANLECSLTKKDRSVYPAELTISSLRDAQGVPAGFVAIIRDLTAKKRLEERLFQVERLAAIGELAGMVGHDIRNPLQSIKGAAYYIKTKADSRLSEKEKTMLMTIESAIDYSDKIVDDLLEYSREIKLDFRETTPKALIQNLLFNLEIPSNIQFKDATGEEPEIVVDSAKLNRVFLNLVKNAFDAMPDGGMLVIRSEMSNGNVVFSFMDTGAGMTQETLTKLWTPLFTTKAKGMGFGLAICKRLVEAHNGRIFVESTIGKGTTFKLVIPVNPPEKTNSNFLVDAARIVVSRETGTSIASK